MSPLFEVTVSGLAGGTSANDLADALDLDSGQDAQAAAMLAVPAVIANLARVSQNPVGAIGLTRMIRAQTVARGTGFGRDGHGAPILHDDVVAAVFGSRSTIVVTVLAEQADLEPDRARWLLGQAGSVCLSALAREFGPGVERAVIAPTLTRQRLQLIEAGWGPWLSRCLGNGNPSDVLELARRISLRPPDPVEPQIRRPPPAARTTTRTGMRALAWLIVGAAALTALAGVALATLT